MANPEAKGKNQLAVAVVLTNSNCASGAMSFIGQTLPAIWAVRWQFDALDSSRSPSRADCIERSYRCDM